ncbi:FAD-dependent monooxygenase [Actinomadura bangladeshensis]|uniref:Monooxygenase n=1 Tax=Actinomadura bangladeshensis TaxID=453573 RepID=A0A4V2XLT8_9ACTN|nr:FAD-dependent monooxygenase [Actinomadura bangladeshensis]TDC11766.1 monooxygenase [Actinomadura bangladeshensis]
MADHEVPVLIAGGSLVGLTASLQLAARGVPHMLVEQHRGTAIHPRAASFHQGTMEVFRSVGVQEAIDAAAEREFVQNGAIIAVESLGGRELQYFYRSYNDGVEGLSPTSRLFITQIGLEPLLRDRARELGAEHRFGTELVGFEQDDTGVTSVIRSRDRDAEETVRSEYLIAADGAHSDVRKRLGIDMAGRGGFADCVTIYFKADVREMLGDRNLSVVYVNHPELLGFFRFSITADSGFLAVFATIAPDGSRDSNVGEGISTARCADLVRTALGAAPDFPVEIDNVQRWSAAAAAAARFRDGRVFLAGDAAHVMPPTGGFGGNTGIADAHNLVWKLAMVHSGAAGPRLLDTYDAERRPISRLTVEQAYTRYVLRVDSSLPKNDLMDPLDDASIELGFVYGTGEAAGSSAATEEPPLEDPRTPTGRAGTRAPHLALEQDGAPISTLDLFGEGFVLLAGPDGQAWCDAAASVAASQEIPLKAHTVAATGPLVDKEERFTEVYGIGARGAVIVRPDRVIGWRTADPADDPRGTIEDVMNRLLFR